MVGVDGSVQLANLLATQRFKIQIKVLVLQYTSLL